MKRLTLSWKIYLGVFSAFTLGNLAYLASESIIYKYYHILIAFTPDYSILYTLDVAMSAVNLLSLIPLFLYAFRVKILGKKLWQILLVARVVLDLVGHCYEKKFMQSIFVDTPWTAGLIVVLLLLFIGPSYLANFEY